MRAENARLGVETTTKNDLTARSAIKPRSRLSTDQRQSARPDHEMLEKYQQGGPRMGSSSRCWKNTSKVVQGWGAVQDWKNTSKVVQGWGAVQDAGKIPARWSKDGEQFSLCVT